MYIPKVLEYIFLENKYTFTSKGKACNKQTTYISNIFYKIMIIFKCIAFNDTVVQGTSEGTLPIYYSGASFSIFLQF